MNTLTIFQNLSTRIDADLARLEQLEKLIRANPGLFLIEPKLKDLLTPLPMGTRRVQVQILPDGFNLERSYGTKY